MANEAQSGTWLTTRRLRAHALLLAATLWSVFLWTLATPGLRDRNGNLKGTDFLHFYTLGWLAQAHRGGSLYDMNAQAAVASELVPAAAGIRYLPLYPPQVSIVFAPLARLPYGWALAVWWLCSAVIYAVCCYFIWRSCPALQNRSGTAALLAIAYPGFFHLIAWGQTSALALALFTVTFMALRERHEFVAGLAFGCLIFKPQLGLAAAVVFIASGMWKVAAGAAVSATMELLVGVAYYGPEPLRAWLQVLSNIRGVLPLLEPRPYQTHCLRTFCSMILPWENAALVLYTISAVIVLGATVTLWKRPGVPLGLRYSALLLASVLVAPHLTVYDLVILAPAFLLVSEWLVSQPRTQATRWMGTVLYLVYMLPLVGPLSRWTHVQLSVIVMLALLYLIASRAVELRLTGQPRAAVPT